MEISWSSIKGWLLLGLIILGIIGGIYAFTSWTSVGQSEALLIVDAGTHQVTVATYGPAAGFYVNGFARIIGLQSPISIYYGVDSVSMWSEWKWSETNKAWEETSRGDFPAIKTLASDGLEIEVDIQVRWTLKPDKLVALYKRFPRCDWENTAINSIVREVVRNTVSRFSAIQVIENRTQIAEALSVEIKAALLSDPTLEGAIDGDSLIIDLRDLDPDSDFLKSISAKMQAYQGKLQALYDYETTITRARGEAEAKVI
ncbi:SPFH domain-containing protein, partial [Candidatus Bathyarchaeota archaeon]|nr:SPFH domain-containing protein [Candidatus Bathyarchaeota archaeon]